MLSERISQELRDAINRIASAPSLSNWENIKKINSMVETNQLLGNLNTRLVVPENICVNIGFNNINSMLSTDIGQLVAGVEHAKRDLYNVFESGKYVAVKCLKGVYFVPEKDAGKISIKEFFLMSSDGFRWESINFAKLTGNVNSGFNTYLYNQYTNQVFVLTRENGADVIAILNIEIPLKKIKLAGMMSDRVSLEEINGYIATLEADERKRQEEIALAEEQRQRTYKGVVFESLELKEEAINNEKEIQQYCTNLSDKSFDELWEKKEAISQLPAPIFSNYVYQLLTALQSKENYESNQYLEKINTADLTALSEISISYRKHNFSDNTKKFLDDALLKRTIICQRLIFDNMIADMEKLDRKALATLITNLNGKSYDVYLTQEYVEKVNRQVEILEKQELRDLCANVEKLSIEELDVLSNTIKQNNYQPRFTEPYYQMIESRVDYIHVKNMEQFCNAMPTANRETVTSIKNKIDAEKCKNELKSKFYALIDERNEQLDYDDLCKLTANVKSKSLNEQEQIYKQLQSGKYNEKFIKEFLTLVGISVEKSRLAFVENKLAGLESRTKSQVNSLKDELENSKYDERIIKHARLVLIERIYELDMQELMELRNNFDDLSLADIQDLRSRIKQKNVCERALVTYEKKLKERELQIGYERACQASYFAKQIIQQNGLFDVNILLPIFSQDYVQGLYKHFQLLGREDYSDIPVVIVPECSDLVITKKSLYFLTPYGYAGFNLSDIITFSVDRKMFKDNLLITFTNGRVESLSSGISKSHSDAFVNMIATVCHNVRNEGALAQYPLYKNHVSEITKEAFEFIPVPKVSEQFIVDIFVNDLIKENTNMRNSYIKHLGINNWEALENKVRYGMGIMNDQIVCYYDSSMMGSAKDGFAIGTRFIHIKNSNQMLMSIPMNDIYEVVMANNNLVIVDKNNNVINLCIVGNDENLKFRFTEMLASYVKGIQMVSTEQVESKQKQEEQVVCPQCNTVATVVGAKFCKKCGAKLM